MSSVLYAKLAKGCAGATHLSSLISLYNFIINASFLWFISSPFSGQLLSPQYLLKHNHSDIDRELGKNTPPQEIRAVEHIVVRAFLGKWGNNTSLGAHWFFILWVLCNWLRAAHMPSQKAAHKFTSNGWCFLYGSYGLGSLRWDW